MGKRQRRREREQQQQQQQKDQGETPAAVVQAGLAEAASSVPGPGNDSED
jgi:hypothetical protein